MVVVSRVGARGHKMSNQAISEENLGYHAQDSGRIIDDFIAYLRDDVNKLDEPRSFARGSRWFAEGVDHCELRSEKAWRVSEDEFKLFAVKEGLRFPRDRSFGCDRGGWRQRKEWWSR